MNDVEWDRLEGDWYIIQTDKESYKDFIPQCMKMVMTAYEDMVKGGESEAEYLKQQKEAGKSV